MFTDQHVDSVAQRLTVGEHQPVEVREYLLSIGLTEYQAFLCYKAAQYLLRVGYYTKGEPVLVG